MDRVDHHPPPLEDPGKDDRAAHGVPVVPAFDGYRAFAIMAIVLFHTLINSGVVADAGGNWGGQLIWGVLPQLVDVLFIISGFVVFLPTVAQRGRFGDVGAYAIRRAARLLPAFWVSLVMLLAAIALISPAAPTFPGVGEILLNFSGEHGIATMWDVNTSAGFGINLALWTLSLEITFYIVLPFIAAAYYRRPFVGLAIAAAIAIVWREAFAHMDVIAGWFGAHPSPTRLIELRFGADQQFPQWAFSFGAGMTAAWAYVRIRDRYDPAQVARIATPIALGALACTALSVYFAGRYAVTTEFPFASTIARQSPWLAIGYTASLASLMLALSLSPRRWQLPFAHPLARRLGDVSYGVYLIHGVVLWVLIVQFALPQTGSVGAFVLWAALVFPISLAYGYLSARFLEQPIRRWAHRFGRRAQASGPDAPAAGLRALPRSEAPRG